MKKILAVVVAAMFFGVGAQPAWAYTATVLTSSIGNATVGTYYSARISFTTDATVGIDVTVTGLPAGVVLVNGTTPAGFTSPASIYALNQKDASGNYYFDLAGTPTTAGSANINVEIFNPDHSLELTKIYSIQVTLNAVDQTNVHTNGTNILDAGTVYFIQNNTRRPYTSAGAFLSYGFNSWAQVKAATSGDRALPVGDFVPPRNGSLINDNGTIYLISDGLRFGFTTMTAFTTMGYKMSNVVKGDTAFMQKGFPNIEGVLTGTLQGHLPGTLVSDMGSVYVIKTGGFYGFPSMAVFNSWGYHSKEVVAMNATDKIWLSQVGILSLRTSDQLNP